MTKLRNGAIMLMFVTLWGCSDANNNTVILDSTGKHPVGWIVPSTGGLHPSAYKANPGACVECHGSAQNAQSTGGTSGISCFSASYNGIACHPNGPSGHPAGWSAPANHGSAAKATPDASHGFASCTNCHGTDYKGSAGKSCMSCHTTAPHPAAPWHGTTSSGTTHTTTDQANATECSRCHAGGVKLTTPGAVLPNAGCFNSTLCHAAVGHPAGWTATGHQVTAKAAATASSGMDSCRSCHGADFKGGTTGFSCMQCHTAAPHSKPWLTSTGATTRKHSTVDVSNALACGRCHAGGAKLSTPTTPPANAGCFNSTLCHAEVGHPAGWTATGHQVAAKAAATSSTGLDSCRSCHGADFKGGTAGVSCMQCHTTSPHSKPWLTSTGATTHKHSTADATNALACGRCHAGGAKLSTPTTPPADSGCFNSTLCHASAAGHAFPYPGSTHLSANSTACLTCHAQGSTSSTYPVSAGTAPNCRGCHLNANPGTTPQCSDCHGTVANNSVAKMAGRPAGGTTFPNREGKHNSVSNHKSFTCTSCHLFTSGDSRHGWSNGVKSTAAQVGGTGTLITSWVAATKSCTSTVCHGDSTVRQW
jgi:hypothetical protein